MLTHGAIEYAKSKARIAAQKKAQEQRRKNEQKRLEEERTKNEQLKANMQKIQEQADRKGLSVSARIKESNVGSILGDTPKYNTTNVLGIPDSEYTPVEELSDLQRTKAENMLNPGEILVGIRDGVPVFKKENRDEDINKGRLSWLDLTLEDTILKNTDRYKQYAQQKSDKEFAENNIYSESDVREVYDTYDANAVTKFQVNAITVKDYDAVQEALSTGNAEIWYINKGSDTCRKEADFSTQDAPIIEIGSDRLAGITVDDRCVIYDKTTGKLYKYASPSDTYKSADAIMSIYDTKMFNLSNVFNSVYASYEARGAEIEAEMDAYIARAEAGESFTDEDFANYQRLSEEYTAIQEQRNTALEKYGADYSDALNKYNEAKKYKESKGMSATEWEQYKYLKQKTMPIQVPNAPAGVTYTPYKLSEAEELMLQELEARINSGNTTIYANADWLEALNNDADAIENARAEYEAQSDKFSDFYSETQVNSALDVIRRMVSRTVFKQDLGATVLDDVKEVLGRSLVKPFQYAIDSLSSTRKDIVSEIKAKHAEAGEDVSDFKVWWEAANIANLPRYAASLQDAGAMLVMNNLVNLGETFDVTNVVKPFIVGANAYGMRNSKYLEDETLAKYNRLAVSKDSNALDAAWESFKTYWGQYGTTPSFEYDQLFQEDERTDPSVIAGIMMWEVMFDPGTYVSAFTKSGSASKIATKFQSSVSDAILNSFTDAGVHIAKKSDMANFVNGQVEKMWKYMITNNMSDMEATYMRFAQKVYDDVVADAALKSNLTDMLTKSTKDTYANALHSSYTKFSTKALENFKSIPAEDLSTAYKTIASIRRLETAEQTLSKIMFAAAAPGFAVPAHIARKAAPLFKVIKTPAILQNVVTNVERIGKHVSSFFDKRGALAKDIREMINTVDNELAHFLDGGIADDSTKAFLMEFAQDTFEPTVNFHVYNEINPILDILNTAKDADVLLKQLDDYVLQNIPDYDGFISWYRKVLSNKTAIGEISTGAEEMLEALSRKYNALITDSKINKLNKYADGYVQNIKAIKEQMDKMFVKGGIDVTTAEARQALTWLHNSVHAMSTGFNPAYTKNLDVKQYKELVATLTDDIIRIGDTPTGIVDNITANEFTVHLNEFINMTQKYVQEINDGMDYLRYKAYKPTVYDEAMDVASTYSASKATMDNFAQKLVEYVRSNNHVNLSKEEILKKVLLDSPEDVLIKDGTVSLDNITKLYRIMTDKISSAKMYTSNLGMRNVVKTVTDVNTDVNVAMQNLKHSVTELCEDSVQASMRTAPIKMLEEALMSQRHTDAFITNLSKELSEDALSLSAFLDAFMTCGTDINYKFNNMISNADITHTADTIVNRMVDSATAFLAGTSDARVTKMFEKGCNSVDTAQNVNSMLSLIKREKIHTATGEYKTIEEVLNAESDKYIDVFYSSASTVRNADPLMLSFSVGGELKTFRNADAPFTMLKDTAYELYGQSYGKAARAYEQVSNNIPGLSADSYVTAIEDYLNTLYVKAAEEGKQVRFIGFNSSALGVGQERAINKLAHDHNFGIHIKAQVDVANYIRAEKGIPVIPKESINGLRRTIVDTLRTANAINKVSNIRANVVMDATVNYRVLADEISNLVALDDRVSNVLTPMLDSLRRSYDAIELKRAGSAHGLAGKIINEHALTEMIIRESNNPRQASRVNCVKLIRSLDGSADAQLGLKIVLNVRHLENWFDTDTIAKIVGSKKNLKGGSKGIDLSAYFNQINDVVYSLDKVYNRINNPTLLNNIGKDAYETAYKILFSEISKQARVYDYKTLKILSNLNLNTAEDYFSAAMYLMQRYASVSPNPVKIASTVNKLEITKTMSREQINSLVDALETLEYDTASSLVFNTSNIIKHNVHDKAIISKHNDAFKDINFIHARYEEFDAHSRMMENFEMYLSGRENIASANNIVTAQDLIHYTLFDEVFSPYRTLCDNINSTTPDKVVNNIADPIGTAQQQYARNVDIAVISDNIKTLQTTHKHRAVQTVLSLSDEDFVTHVIRNCNNALIIDPNAAMFKNKDMNSLLYNKLKSLKNKGELVVDEVVIPDPIRGIDNTYIRIYKDLTGSTAKDIDTLYSAYDKATLNMSTRYLDDLSLQNKVRNEYNKHVKEYVDKQKEALKAYLRELQNEGVLDSIGANAAFVKQLNDINREASQYAVKQLLDAKILVDGITEADVNRILSRESSLFDNEYFECMEKMANNMPDAYLVSTFETITQETMANIQAYFPEASRLDLAGRFNSWADSSFNCSIIGDNTTQSLFNSYASDNIINNIGMGLNHVRNKLEATTNYLAMYNNPTQSLSYMVKHAGAEDWTPKQLAQAIDNKGHVLTAPVFKNGQWTAEKLTLKTQKQLDMYMNNPNVICVPNEVFLEIQQYTKGANKQWKLEHANAFQRKMFDMVNYWERNVKSMRMIGYLFTAYKGAAVRNMFGATWNALNDIGTGYLGYAANALEWQNSYTKVITDILESGEVPTRETITAYFKNNPTPPIAEDLFMDLHAFNTSTAVGLSDTFSMIRDNQASKLKGLLPKDLGVTDEMLANAQSIFQKVHAKHFEQIDKPLAVMEEEAYKRIKKLGYTEEQTKALADLFYNYTPSTDALEAQLKNIPLAGNALYKYIEFNKAQFSEAETVSRTAMAMYYMRECGYTVNQANKKVIAAQFDYNSRPKWLDRMELIMPFSTFKVYNAKYWLLEAPNKYMTMRNAMHITHFLGDTHGSEEFAMYIRNSIMREKIQNGEILVNEDGTLEDSTTHETPGFAHVLYHTVQDVVEEYKGVPSLYASGIRVGDNHILKVGNTFVDALNFLSSSYLAPLELANGLVPTILGDNVYSPLATMLAGMNEYIRNGGSLEGERIVHADGTVEYTGFYKWLNENYYDVIDLIPFWGALTSNVINHIKNGNLNLADMVAMNCDPSLKDEFVKRMFESSLNIAGAIMPSLVGTIYDMDDNDKPIGYDWYNQSEEYRRTHRFVQGVSYYPSYWSKDPATYVNYKGMYMKMGYTEEEALEILNFLYARNPSGTQVYERPGMYKYDLDLVNYTLETLVGKGYSAEEAIDLISKGIKWVDPVTGEIRNRADVASEMLNSAFLAKYNIVPDYIKYDKHQYNMLKEYYKLKGYDTEQTWMLMYSANGYIDEQGEYRTLTDAQVTAYTKQLNEDYLEFTDGLPDWYKYEPGAATRSVNALIAKGMSLNKAREFILQNNYYVDEDNVEHFFTDAEMQLKSAQSTQEFNDYYSQLPNYIKYEKGAHSRTLSYLKGTGCTTEEAKALIKQGAYLTVDERLINCSDLERAHANTVKYLNDDEFKEYYSTLPDFIKHEKGAFSRTYAHLKALGHSYNKILDMIKGGAYVDANGMLINCSGLKAPARGSYYTNQYYNNYTKYKKRAPRPKSTRRTYIKKGYTKKPFVTNGSYSSTYSKVNAMAGASYGMRKVFKKSLGYNPVRQSLSIKSTYPTAYRNIVYGYRRNLYKEMYAKYGISRIMMRSGGYKSYSNACIVKLRRNEIYSRLRYAKRRSNF